MLMDSLKSMRWTLYTTGAILIVLGVIAIFHPLASILSLAIFIGVGFIIAGINHLIPYFSMRGNPLRPGWLLPQGILDILLGVIMLTRIGMTSLMIPIVFGIWMLFASGMRVYVSFRLKSQGFRKWWIMLLSGLLLLLCGLAMIANPFVGFVAVTSMIAAALIGAGLLAIAEGRLIYSDDRK